MADEQLEAPKSEKKKGGMLKWIIILVVLLGLVAAGFFAWPIIKNQLLGGEAPANATQETEAQPMAPAAQPGETELVTLPTFVVNLADPLGRRYLKLTLSVEVANKESAEVLGKSEAKVRDAIILLLSSKTFSELSSIDAKLELKDEIVKRLNQIMGGSSILRVYFTEMVVQ
ncbi:flagellar FliL protein [Desulfobaculum xiamenense]|uniref:Flagellar protein FliL n=1 Tax=Desulfobaculum xiamenense TaxID=995050 RepID=A0A846QRZ1_9BACT|nr:flagellar FliL protein [Desulfobaculum xiamenense]